MGTLNPLEVFPLEVWETIFEKLGGQQGSSINLLNCSNVCTNFEDILKPTQFQWLFESVCPLIFPYLEGEELLKCRRVSKEWCRVIDNFLEKEGRVPFNEETTDISCSPEGTETFVKGKGLWTTFNDTEEILEFMKVMKNEKNPFVGGSLHFNERDDWPNESFFNDKSSELLIEFGKHVKHIIVDSIVGNPEEFYHLLRKYLHSLPNLRSLEIYGEIGFLARNGLKRNRRRLRQLKELLEKNSSSLPQISSLESLALFAYQLPRCIKEKVIDSINPRELRCLKLRLNQLPEEDEDLLMTFKQPLPSLTELHLVQIESNQQFSHVLTNLVGKEAPLGKLVLYFPPAYVSKIKINFHLVFEEISKFGQTLKMLTIHKFQSHDPITELPNPSLSMLKIPHLRSLKIDGVTFGPGYLPSNLAQSLEYLHISLPHELASETEFYEGALDGNLCHSPIWSEMPKLKVIKVLLQQGLVTCSREMHERGVVSEPLKC